MDSTEVIGYMKGWHGIYDPANEDALTNAECLQWLNMARRWLCKKANLRFSEWESTFSLVAGTRAYDLPVGWLDFADLYYIDDNGRKVDLTWYSSKARFDKKYPVRTEAGTPTGAVQWGNSILIGPVPDEDMTLYVSGHVLPDDLGLGATDDMLNEVWEECMWFALVTSGEYHTVPEQKHSEWKTRAAEGYENLRVRYRTAKTPPGRIVTRGPGTIITQNEED